MGQNSMEFLAGASCVDILKGRYVFLDNDFVNLLYKNADIFQRSLNYLNRSVLMIDPFTKFEFLRDIFVPTEKRAMEKF